MNPDPSLDSLELPHDMDAETVEESWKPYMEKIARIDSTELQRLESDVYKQAGTISWSTEEYLASEHGKANAHIGLFEIHSHPTQAQKPSWWPESPLTSVKRPLAGLKVVDITRVIAAPAITRGLAEMGASVMRVTAPHLVDYSSLHCDLNWGKWNTALDFRKDDDREKMRQLILEADVVVTGYRPGVLDKYGFGREGVMMICEGRDRGIIYARENCYGWNGPWSYRSGWQQISDAVSLLLISTPPPIVHHAKKRNSAAASQPPSATPWATPNPSLPCFPTATTAPAYLASAVFSRLSCNALNPAAHTPST